MVEITRTPNVLEALAYYDRKWSGSDASKFADPINCLFDNLQSEMLKRIVTPEPEKVIKAYQAIPDAKIDWNKVKEHQRKTWELMTDGLNRNFSINTSIIKPLYG